MAIKGRRRPYPWERVFGFDVFISYARVDGAVYAEALERMLKERGYRCFLDRKDFAAGEELRAATERNLRNSSILVVAVSPKAVESRYVFDEVSIFQRLGRTVIPINFGSTLAKTSTTSRLASVLTNLIWIPEEEEALASGPSEGVTESLINSFDITKRASRRTQLFAGLALVFALLAVVSGVAAYFAVQRGNLAEQRRQVAATRLSRLLEEQGRQELLAGRGDRSLAFLHEALSVGGANPVLRYLIAEAARVVRQGGLTFNLYPVAVVALSFSRDGRILATSGANTSVLLIDPVTGVLLAEPQGHTGTVRSIQLYSDGKYLMTLSEDGIVRVWDAKKALVLGMTPPGQYVKLAEVGQTGKYLLTASEDDFVRLWKLPKLQMERELQHVTDVNSVAMRSDERQAATASWDRKVRLWDLDTGEVKVLDGHRLEPLCTSYSHDKTQLASCGADNTVRIWDANSGRLLRILEGHDDSVVTAAYSPDDTQIVSASADNTARIWDSKTGRAVATLTGHTRGVQAAVFSPSGAFVLTLGGKGRVAVWDAEDGEKYVDFSTSALASAFCPDESCVVTGERSGAIRLWDLAATPTRAILSGHTDDVLSATFSSDGKRIVSASDDHTAIIWDVGTCKPLRTLEGHVYTVASAVFSHDGTRVATASRDGTARIWDTQSGETILVIGDEETEVDSVEFDHRGSRILTAYGDGTAKLWDADAGKVLYELRAGTGAVRSASFSRDGSRLLTTHAGGAARLWSAENGELLLEASVDERITPCAALSPDGSRLAYASGSGNTTVLDTGSESTPAHIPGAGEINSIVFGPRGERILIGSDDREVRLFDLAQNRLLGIIEGHSPSFSPDGDRLLTVDGANLKIWSTRTCKLLNVLRGHTNKVFSADFDSTGRSIVSVARGESPRLWNVGPDERDAESILSDVGGRLRWRLEDGNLVPANGTGEPSLQEQSE